MPAIRVVRIPADLLELVVEEFVPNTPETLIAAVGGGVDHLPVTARLRMCINVEGLQLGLGWNVRASVLAGVPVAGDVIVLGKSEARDVPAGTGELLNAIFTARCNRARSEASRLVTS